jgi:hypothetical protein
MGNWWDKCAADLQQRVKMDSFESAIDYSEEEVRIATVHARQDMVLLVSHLSSISKQLRTISRFSFFILLVLILIAVNI